MGNAVFDVERLVADFPRLPSDLDVSGFDEAGLKALMVQVRPVQRCLEGLVIRIGQQADRLAIEGRSAPAEETVRGEGVSSVGAGQARAESKRASTASGVEGLADAVSAGATSGGHVDSIGRHLAKLTDEQRAGLDLDEIVAKAKVMPADAFDRLMKRLVDRIRMDHGLADAKAKRAASEFRHWFDRNTGMGRFAGSLDPELYEALVNAVEQHSSSLATSSGEPLTLGPNLAAEALVQLATSSGGRDSRNRLPSVTVVVDHDTIVHGANDGSVMQTENGHDLAAETVARLCCDATIRKVTLGQDGVPVNVGRKYRTATDAQWAAIKAVHSGCAWGGCSAPVNWCQAHHIREWEHGGPTDLDNLVPLCSQHHHRVHEGQWHIKMLPNRTLEIAKPDGSHHATVTPSIRE